MAEIELVERVTRGRKSSSRVYAPIGTDDCSVVHIDDVDFLQYRTAVDFTQFEELDRIDQILYEPVTDLDPDFEPLGILTFLGIPRSCDSAKELVSRFKAEVHDVTCDWSIYHLGGDINETKDLVLATTAVGAAESFDREHMSEASSILDVTGYDLGLHSVDAINATLAAADHVDDLNRARGYYVFDANVSDVVCSGGIPAGIQLFSGLDDEDMAEVREGVRRRSSGKNVRTLDAMTTDEPAEYLLGATAIGVAENEAQLTLRSGAREGDTVVVAGTLGKFAAATYALEKGVPLDDAVEEDLAEYIVDTGIPSEEIDLIRRREIGNGGIDVSDGFSLDLSKLVDQSGVSGAEIFADRLPVGPAVETVAEEVGCNALSFTWGLGGDWASIITMARRDWLRIEDATEQTGQLAAVGRLTDERDGLHLLPSREANGSIQMPSMGYQAFDDLDDVGREINDFAFSDRIESDLNRIDGYFDETGASSSYRREHLRVE